MSERKENGESYVNILQKLSQWAIETPDRRAWTFLNDKGEPVESYTYKVMIHETNRLVLLLTLLLLGAGGCL